jgi:acyl-homoserine-lactone acylase
MLKLDPKPWLILLAALVFAPVIGGTQISGANKSTAQAEILWDTWGVPHIFAKDMNSAGRALGWAQMQNHGNRLLRVIARARGRAAEYFGSDLLEADKFTRTMGTYDIARKWRAQQSSEFGQYLEAFVAGINEYGREHPERLTPEARAVLPVDSVDVIANATRFLTSFVATAGGCTSAFAGHSNAWAISPSKSVNGHALLLQNPHGPWDLEWVTFFEAQIVTPDYNIYGAQPVGWPTFPFAFNRALGWALTVNTIDGCDVYELTRDGDGYRFDGKKRAFSNETQIIKVKDRKGTLREVPWDVRRAVQGPVVKKGGKLFAVRVAGLEVSSMAGALEEFWNMAKARNLQEFGAALQAMQIPMFNILYADRDGHIFGIFNGQVPVRSNNDMRFWHGPVPGDTSTLIWNRVHPYRDLPQVRDPRSGWVQSSNGPPWFMTLPFGEPKNYAQYASPQLPGGISDTPRLGWLTAREQSGLRMLMQDGKMTLEKLVEDKYSTRSQLADRVLDDLVKAVSQSGSETAKHAATILQAWDRNVDADSRGAALFEFWAEEMQLRGFPGFYAQPFDPLRPLETPHGLSDFKCAIEALEVAAQKLTKTGGQLDAAWGDLYRLRRGKIDIPANGAGDLLGTFRVIDYNPDSDGRFASEGGDTFIAAVEFSTSLRAKVLLTSGNSSDPNSSHYGDQLVLSAKKQLRDAWVTREEIENHLESRTVFNTIGSVTSVPSTNSTH